MIFPLWAYNGALEWSGYTPGELRVANGFSYIDSEYVSDQLAFSHPIQQEYLWISKDKLSDLTFGSISSDKFLYQGRLKLLTKINDEWKFEYYLFEQQNFEVDQSMSWIGLSYKLNPFLLFGLYGTPESNKGVIDYKLKTTVFISKAELSFYLIKSDFMKNSKAIDDKTYSKKPKAYGFDLVYGDGTDFVNFSGRVDPMSQLQHSSGESSEIKHSAIQLVFQKTFFNRVWRLKSETSKLYEQNSNSLSTNWADQNINEVRVETQKKELLFGLLWKQYDWKTDEGVLKHDNYLPYISYFYDFHGTYQGWTYELTSHESNFKGVVDRSSTDCNSCFEHRFNYTLVKTFNSNFKFSLKFTFDVDEFGTANTWEGGSGQFYLMF